MNIGSTLKNSLASFIAAVMMSLFALSAQATSVSLPSSGMGLWDYIGSGTLIDLSGIRSGDFSDSFSLAGPTTVSIVADDCCLVGDAFGLILDGFSTTWTHTDLINSVNGAGLFHGIYTGVLGTGTHIFALEVTADCCGSGSMNWSVAAVPEPETYAMFMAGLGLMGFIARRRKNGQA